MKAAQLLQLLRRKTGSALTPEERSWLEEYLAMEVHFADTADPYAVGPALLAQHLVVGLGRDLGRCPTAAELQDVVARHDALRVELVKKIEELGPKVETGPSSGKRARGTGPRFALWVDLTTAERAAMALPEDSPSSVVVVIHRAELLPAIRFVLTTGGVVEDAHGALEVRPPEPNEEPEGPGGAP